MTTPVLALTAPVISVNGSPLREDLANVLIGMRISRALRLPARVRLEFLDEGFRVSGQSVFAIGGEIKVKTGAGDQLFQGEITGVELDIDLGAPNLTVIADDAAYKLTLGTTIATYTKMTYSDIVSKVVQEAGLGSVNVSSTPSQQDYVLQADSAFGFVSELADRIGFDWWVDEQGAFHFHPACSQSGDAPSLSWDGPGPNLTRFAVRASALHPHSVKTYGWDINQKTAATETESPFKGTPTASLVSPFVTQGALASKATVITSHASFDKSTDGKQIATGAVVAALTSAVRAEGMCDVNPDLHVGGKVNIVDAGPASGAYWLTEVEHIYSTSGFDTRFVAGERQPVGLVDSLAAPAVSSLRQDSFVTGVVSNNDDPEKLGRVKVKYPTMGETMESEWARVATIGAGNQRGITFMPEINDEVVVGFEGGDSSRPVVLGSVFNGKDKPLELGVQDSKIVKRQIVSRLGHVIQLGDGSGPEEQHIRLTLAGGEHAVHLDKSGLTAKVPSGKPVSISAGDTSIKIDDSGNITLSGKNITIKGQGDVEISGTNIKIKATASVEASGAQVKIAGNGTAELSSGGMTAVKGATVAIN